MSEDGPKRTGNCPGWSENDQEMEKWYNFCWIRICNEAKKWILLAVIQAAIQAVIQAAIQVAIWAVIEFVIITVS